MQGRRAYPKLTLPHESADHRFQPDAHARAIGSSARIANALLHRNVGTVQLLRDARIARFIHDRHRRRWRIGIQRQNGDLHLRPLHCVRLSGESAGRLDRRSLAGRSTSCLVRGHYHRCRTLHPGAAGFAHLLSRAHLDCHWNRALEAEHQCHRRRLVSRRRFPAGRRLQHFLHGSQPGRIPGTVHLRWPRPGADQVTTTGTGDSPPRAWGWCWDLSSIR